MHKSVELNKTRRRKHKDLRHYHRAFLDITSPSAEFDEYIFILFNVLL